MNSIIIPVKWQFAFVNLDDIIISSRTLEDHIEHFQPLLSLVHVAIVTLNLQNCKFGSEEKDYFRHLLRFSRFYHSFHTVEAIHNLKPLRHVGELKSFLGLWNVYGLSVPSFAQLPAALSTKLKKGKLTSSTTCPPRKWTLTDNIEETHGLISVRNATLSCLFNAKHWYMWQSKSLLVDVVPARWSQNLQGYWLQTPNAANKIHTRHILYF